MASTAQWPAEVHEAYEVIKKTYDQAVCVLRSDSSSDPTRVTFHIDALSSTALPILEALIPSSISYEDECLPIEWIVGVARLLGQAVQDLQAMAHVANTLEQQGVSIPELVMKVTNGQQGRPQKSVCPDFLTEVVTNRIGRMMLW
ncbi:hypothetical protein SCLCIDRAFT_9868 [Scleroderma citrinum Foug A]|uniref:Uncharacterized protein n=1 Tax=Scleroderma citrinum Foug A TaxID=1036808 RepID=A0A0C3A558_9AGAM|nr:hypothetical protein SCLCIDRAFT_9868 [Scleroderma citrinum Foug A]